MMRFIILTALVATSMAAVPRLLPKLRTPTVPITGRIVGGEETTIDQVPYQVVYLLFGSYICGGSIIRQNAVLSAAHCVLSSNPSSSSFRAGSSNYNSGGQVVGVSQVFEHERYDGEDYDFALFILSSSLNFGANIAAVALPAQGQSVADNAPATTSGWGAIYENGPVSSVVRKVVIPIVNQDTCVRAYASGGWRVTDAEICAGVYGVGGKDACQGDSGGPLVVENQLVGVTSWGIGCARADFPGVWARVPVIVDWINEKLFL